VTVLLYRLSLTRARLLGMFPNPANDNLFRLVLGGTQPDDELGPERAVAKLASQFSTSGAEAPTPSPRGG
jgi:hypothetical protein